MSFESQYQRLNPAQKAAVDTIDGPIMVVAGPGTGKTHILTLRIANILRTTDANPGNILALTFTDSAARTMRSRLVALIGQPGYSVRIETFHALADTLIREYPEYFPFERDASPLLQLEQFSIIRSLLENPDLRFLRTPGSKYHYAKDIISAISALKRENIYPEKFQQVVSDEQTWFTAEKTSLKKTELLKWEALLGKHLELAPIYAAYQSELGRLARYDFDDMLLTTHSALENNPLLLASLQEQFQYLLVDEYQDTNGVQNAIVDLIASFWGADANIFVVGDPNQTIFRFQGATLTNTLGFLDRYPKATLITLNQGYRSNQVIYTTAHQILTPILASLTDHPLASALKLPLIANHNLGQIEFSQTNNDTDELLLLVGQIRDLITSGVKPSEIAVLYKKNAEGDQLAKLFARAQIPFHTEHSVNVLLNPSILQFFTLLTLLDSLTTATEQRLLFDVFSFAWFKPTIKESLPSSLTLLQLMRFFATQKTITTPFEFICQPRSVLNKLTHLKTLDMSETEGLHEIANILSSWVEQEAKLTFPEFIELLARESGFLNFLVIDHTQAETLTSFITLLKEIGNLADGKHSFRLSDFLAYLATMAEQNLTLASSSEVTSDDVTLATVHKAKGREWRHVFIPFFKEGYWGKTRSKSGITLPEGLVSHPQASDPEFDERRLLFVALTRAKEVLHLSFALTTKDGERSKDNLVSPLAIELSSLGTPKLVEVDPKLQELFITPVSTTLFDERSKSWLATLVATLPLSASALNTYLESPRLFYERFILKLPEATKPHLAYGTAIHAALEFFYREYLLHEHTYPSKEKVFAVFEQKLKSSILTPNDLTSRLYQGHETLTAFLESQNQVFPEVVTLEESFGWKRGKVRLGDVELTGKIDRIDLGVEPTQSLTVIDYKTGKPKTMGDITGTTKSSDPSARELLLPEIIRGSLKRQLLFYKLLLSLDPKYKQFKIESGSFVFVEPQNGTFTTRRVSLDEEALSALKQLIIEVMAEIRSLKFLEAL